MDTTLYNPVRCTSGLEVWRFCYTRYRIDCRSAVAFTEEEIEALKDGISGQNSDGFGEGFEQRPIETDEGDMYVSFWNSKEGYD